MPTFKITDPNTGKTIRVTGDSPPDELELEQIFSAAGSGHEGQPAPKPGLMGRALDALAVPEAKSREGLKMLASGVPAYSGAPAGALASLPLMPLMGPMAPLAPVMGALAGEKLSPSSNVPSGNLIRDLVTGAPRIGADTMAEAAPEFISRDSIVTAGALKGVKAAATPLKVIGRGAAKAAESISGLEYKTPGVLKDAAKDATLMLSPGMKKAGELFKDLMAKGRVRESFGRATGSKELLDDAIKALDDGSLTPEEALIARQTLDGIKKTLPRFSFQKMRDAFDAIAKTKSSQADAAFSRAVKADELRRVFPVNKLGGTSIAKSTLGTIAGAVPLMAMSPLVQGATATVVGAGARAGGKLARQASKS